MKHRYCDIPQDVLLRLLHLPEGTKIVRMDVVHDSKVVGPVPLRIVLESEEWGDVYRDTSMTSVSPLWDQITGDFFEWWYGLVPPFGFFCSPERMRENGL